MAPGLKLKGMVDLNFPLTIQLEELYWKAGGFTLHSSILRKKRSALFDGIKDRKFKKKNNKKILCQLSLNNWLDWGISTCPANKLIFNQHCRSALHACFSGLCLVFCHFCIWPSACKAAVQLCAICACINCELLNCCDILNLVLVQIHLVVHFPELALLICAQHYLHCLAACSMPDCIAIGKPDLAGFHKILFNIRHGRLPAGIPSFHIAHHAWRACNCCAERA